MHIPGTCSFIDQDITRWDISKIPTSLDNAFIEFENGYGVFFPNNGHAHPMFISMEDLSQKIHNAGYRFENGKGWIKPNGDILPFVKRKIDKEIPKKTSFIQRFLPRKMQGSQNKA